MTATTTVANTHHRHLRPIPRRVHRHHHFRAVPPAGERHLLAGHEHLPIIPPPQRRQRRPHRRETTDRRRQIRLRLTDGPPLRPQRPVIPRRPRPARTPLAAVVHRRHPGHRKQHAIQRIQLAGITQRTRYPIDIVVVREVRHRQLAVDAIGAEHPVERKRNLKQILVRNRRPQTLVALIIGGPVQHPRPRDPAIIPADHLPHQPHVLAQPVRLTGQRRQKSLAQHIRSIQPQTRNSKLLVPHAHRREQVFANLRVVRVELHQIEIARPPLVGKRIALLACAGEIEIKPVPIGRILSVGNDILKRPKLPTHMVEHRVQDQPHVSTREFVGQPPHGVEVAQPAVDREIVDGVVPMRRRLEHRTKLQRGDAQTVQIVQPLGHRVEAGDGRAGEVVARRSAARAERIHVIHHIVIGPHGVCSPPFVGVGVRCGSNLG